MALQRYNSFSGAYEPQFAGNKPGGRVSTCQDSRMRSTTGDGTVKEVWDYPPAGATTRFYRLHITKP